VNVRELEEQRLFGDEEERAFEEEEVALDGFEVGFEPWVAIAALEAA